jgi:hypothetical protein
VVRFRYELQEISPEVVDSIGRSNGARDGIAPATDAAIALAPSILGDQENPWNSSIQSGENSSICSSQLS